MLWINCGLFEWPLKRETLAIIRMLKPAILFRDDSNFYRGILEKSFTFSFYNRVENLRRMESNNLDALAQPAMGGRAQMCSGEYVPFSLNPAGSREKCLMVNDTKFLIGVEGSDASLKCVSYVAGVMEQREAFHIMLFHVLSPTPPELLEFGGSEDPRTEEKLDEELKRKQGEWLEKAKKSAEPIFEQAHEILSRKGVPPENITTGFSQSIHRPDVVRELLEAAHHYQCGTIVVGREMYSSFKEMFHRHVGEELVRQAQGVAVWVIA